MIDGLIVHADNIMSLLVTQVERALSEVLQTAVEPVKSPEFIFKVCDSLLNVPLSLAFLRLALSVLPLIHLSSLQQLG